MSSIDIKYCPKCHREAYRLVTNEDKIKILQGKTCIIETDKLSKISVGIKCPSGHPVKLEIGNGTGKHSGSQD